MIQNRWYRVYIPRQQLFSKLGRRLLFATGSTVILYTGFTILNVSREVETRKFGWGSFFKDRNYRELAESDALKTIGGLMACNLLVFIGWRIPRLRLWMTRHFTTDSHGFHPSWTLITSIFSHQNASHMAMNMLGLYTLGMSMYSILGQEQFLFMYITTGMWGNFLSSLIYSFGIKTQIPITSLGASGGLYSFLGVMAHFPHTSLRLIFLPFISLPITLVLSGLVLYDIYGLGKMASSGNGAGPFRLDHAAHLSGMALGYLYYEFGREYIWGKRYRYLKSIGYLQQYN
jgi:membrane associated rhomboid family serine protease